MSDTTVFSPSPSPPSSDSSAPNLPDPQTTVRANIAQRIRHELVPALGPISRPSRLLWYGALLMLASAAFHTVVFLFSDTTWDGAVSWRKPITFGLSFAALFWSFGWILDRLPSRPRLAWPLAVTYTVTSMIEVGLITFQQWRGRPSHFNTFEGENALIFALMGLMVVFISLSLIGLFVWALIERPSDPLERLAIIGGMVLILLGLGIGQQIINLGNAYVEQFDQVPDTVISGDAGVAKFPHGVAFHGLQVFAIAAVLLGTSVVDRTNARRAMRAVVAGYFGVLVFSITQTFGGRAPMDLDVISGFLLAVSAAVLIGALLVIVRWWLLHPQPASTSTSTSTSADHESAAHRPIAGARGRFDL